MVAIPQKDSPLVKLIDAYHEFMAPPPRYHMGASLLGHHCERYLWLNFRWAVIEKHTGRMLRLFRRGQNEEETIVSDLKNAGIDIRFTGANQITIDFGCHVAGSLDGVIYKGVPESPTKKHIAEFKTHGLKSFAELVNHGVQKSKPTHYAQMQNYMLGSAQVNQGKPIDRALYVGVCKDNDNLHIERVKLDKKFAEKTIQKGKRIAVQNEMPPPVSTDPSWYQCKMCSYSEFCHETKTTDQVNCRTCAHSTAKEDGTWFCEKWKSTIPNKNQISGCWSHVIHPDLTPWKLAGGLDEWNAIYIIDGKKVVNGSKGFKSNELLTNPKACAHADKFVNNLRDNFGAEATG